MQNPDKRNLEKEFKAFLVSKELSPPSFVLEGIRSKILREIAPSDLQVFSKLITIHLLSGMGTLLVCPQFGIGPFGGGNGMMGFVMAWGSLVCALFCGGFFFGTSAVISQFLLTRDQWRVFHQERWVHFSALIAVTIGLFMVFSWSDFLADLDYVLVWVAGGLMMMVAIDEGISRLRLAP